MTKKSAATIRIVLITILTMLIAEIAVGATGLFIKDQHDEIRVLRLQDEHTVNQLDWLAGQYSACQHRVMEHM